MALRPCGAAETGGSHVAPELKIFLSQKEQELAQLVAGRTNNLKEADTLARQVEAQKEKPNRDWFEQRALEKNLATLRAQLEDIERVTARERAVREEAFAYAAAIVAELETSLKRQFIKIQQQQREASRQREADRVVPLRVLIYTFTKSGVAIERALVLDEERRVHQGKMNALQPHNPPFAELPKGVPWSKEMIEDQRRAYEEHIVRLKSEREQLLKEERLRESLADALPEMVGTDWMARKARINAQVVEYDRKIEIYQDKLDRMSVTALSPEL